MSENHAPRTPVAIAAALMFSAALSACATQAAPQTAAPRSPQAAQAADILQQTAGDSPFVAAVRHRAAAGNVPAEVRLGLAYLRGRGLQQDFTKGRMLLEDAAAHHGPAAMADLGLIYLRGLGVRQDDHQALAWFRRSAQANWPLGQYWLGYMYENGIGTARNLRSARFYMAQAVLGGYRPAVRALAALHKETKQPGGDK